MSKLKEKSEFNIEAAKVLIDKSLYAPSVHCSYYSCFQLMKFTMKDFFHMSYDELNNNVSVNPKGGTHSYVTHYFNNAVKKKYGYSDYTYFSRQIKDLKEFRESSDYGDTQITIDESSKALQYAKEIRYFIQKKLKK